MSQTYAFFAKAVLATAITLLAACYDSSNLSASESETFLESDSSGSTESSAVSPNILLLIGDDIGVEALASYGIGIEPALTPNLDQLAADGVQFNSVWSQPTCSPTRATIMTGQYGFRSGLGMPSGGAGSGGQLPETLPVPAGSPTEHHEDLAFPMQHTAPWSTAIARSRGLVTAETGVRLGLDPDAVGLPSVLKELAPQYTSAAFGKWHLADIHNGWLTHPDRIGFDHYSILQNNGPESYFSWTENTNGEVSALTGYTPEYKVAQTLEWANSQDSPWFVWYAFNLPHIPLYVPEASGIDLEASPELLANQIPEPGRYFDLMVAEMDRMIGLLLDGLSPEQRENTVVIFVGDNGTSPENIDPPFSPERPKFTLYQGGIHVPLIVSGPGVYEGGTTDALVTTTDLFETVLSIATGANQEAQVDSVGLFPYLQDPESPPLRDYAYADKLFPRIGIEYGDFAIRDERYKLISSLVRQELFDLQQDPYESNNLLAGTLDTEQRGAMERLLEYAQALHSQLGLQSPIPAEE